MIGVRRSIIAADIRSAADGYRKVAHRFMGAEHWTGVGRDGLHVATADPTGSAVFLAKLRWTHTADAWPVKIRKWWVSRSSPLVDLRGVPGSCRTVPAFVTGQGGLSVSGRWVGRETELRDAEHPCGALGAEPFRLLAFREEALEALFAAAGELAATWPYIDGKIAALQDSSGSVRLAFIADSWVYAEVVEP